ncbi:MAG: wax ester/triacylglycerol synthase family O-acyltransferase [Actinomycetota bacterium]|nr:wax ester/triacylglycerol synthase family O-acyltransferase [Actinomycetota bacterium]
MSDRVRADDAALLSAETARAPRHVSVLMVLDPGERGLDHDALLRLIDDRIALVPRYRQVIRSVFGGLASPVWVDDGRFDLSYHVRRSALPQPGSMAQLHDLASRLVARALDRQRPLWELYLIEGLGDGRVAMLLKGHQVLIDGIETVALGQIIMDDSPEPRDVPAVVWQPQPAPSQLTMVSDSLTHSVRRPGRLISQLVTGIPRLPMAPRGLPGGPLLAALSLQRGVVTIDAELNHHRAVRDKHGGTINDVVLAVVAGALRGWLLTRAAPLAPDAVIRTMVPLSVHDHEAEPNSLGSHVAGHLLSLPVGETNPVLRLQHVSYALKAHKETGRAVSADRLVATPGMASTTFHALASRVADSQAGLGYQLVVSNVPGPQEPMYAGGARLVATYPILPLTEPRTVAIGVSSYDGRVFYGGNTDRVAVPDSAVLAQCLSDALEELVDTTRPGRSRAPRGRSKGPVR